MMQRTIRCKECHKDFSYEYKLNTTPGSAAFGLRGTYTKKYCDVCAKVRKHIQNVESTRAFVARMPKTAKVDKPKIITKKDVIRNALKYVVELYKHLEFVHTSSHVYDKVIEILPDDYVSRDVLRRNYREAKLKNEI